MKGASGPEATREVFRGAPIVLVGFMGAGKTTAGRLLAERLGRRFLDLDDLVAALAGRSAAELIQTRGEERFRAVESRALDLALRTRATVVAAGGGAVLRARNRALLARPGIQVAWLRVSAEEALRRCHPAGPATEGGTPRPLFPATLPEVRALLAGREPAYREVSTLEVETTGLSCSEVAEALALALAGPGGPGAVGPASGGAVALVRGGPDGHGPLAVGFGLLERLSDLPGFPAVAGGRALLAADPVAHALYGRRVEEALARAGLEVLTYVLPPGEKAKTARQLATLWEEMARGGLGRHDVVVSLGGGTVSDVAGLAAATYVRGLPVVHAPTTLLAQVDAAVGGKTAVNLTRGKNLAGVFHFPSLVASDLETLGTLPRALVVEGMVELVKTLLVTGSPVRELAGDVERATAGPAGDGGCVSPSRLGPLVERAAAAKLAVVKEDPHDHGPRAALNLGHTFAHGLERAAGFGRVRHGLAVAVGVVAAARLSREMGLLDEDDAEAVSGLIRQTLAGVGRRALGRAVSVRPSEALRWAALDKKRTGRGGIVWVLLRRAPGGGLEAEPVGGVPERAAAGALAWAQGECRKAADPAPRPGGSQKPSLPKGR